MKLLKFINYEKGHDPEEQLDILYYQWFYEMINNEYSSNALIFDPFNPNSNSLPKVSYRFCNPVTLWLHEDTWPVTVKQKLQGRKFQGLVELTLIQKNMSDLRVDRLEFSLAYVRTRKIAHVRTFLEWELLKLIEYDKVENLDSGLDETYYKWFYEQILKGFAKETLTFEPYKKIE